jgi:hypothetical protein
MCDSCQDTGIVMVDVGTATIPDYIEATCKCQLAWPSSEFDYPAFDVPYVDYDPPLPLGY